MAAATHALPDGYHLSFSISRSLWADLLAEALPIQVGTGEFDAVQQVRGLLNGVQTQISQMKLLESPKVPPVAAAAGVRALGVLKKAREGVSRRVDRLVRVKGKWRLEVTRDGSEFVYGQNGVTLHARLNATAEGRADLLDDQFEVPFLLQKAISGTITLGDVQFDRNTRSLQGRVKDVGLILGDHPLFKLLKPYVDKLLEQKLIGKVNPLTLLRGEQLENLITPGQGPLKLSAGISDILVSVDDDRLTLSVRFAFRGVH